MSNPFIPRAGAVFSADIAVPGHEKEFRFYSSVLATGTEPLWRKDLLNNLGLPVIGLGPQSEEYAHLPLQWMPHIQVIDVATSVERALSLGGTELMHAKDDDGNSQWAVLLDPNGAAFGIVPVVPEEQIPPLNSDTTANDKEIGRIHSISLTVTDVNTTRDFYQQVVGWSTQDVEAICIAGDPTEQLPPVWMIYLPVGDLAESLRRVELEGGKIIKTSTDATGKRVYAVVQDPVGVHFALIQAGSN